MNLFGYVSPVRRQLSRVACSIVQNWEASFNPLDAQFSVSHVQYWETSFNPLDVSASVVRSMSVPTKTFLSLSRRVSRDLQSRAINRVLNNRDASCKVAQSHAISTVVRKRKESLLRFGGATPCVVRSRDSVSVALCRVAHYRGCQYRQKPRTVVRSMSVPV
jgi:hypothetical protein